MKKLTKMPTDGQFVAVWEYDGKIWSDVFKFKNGRLYQQDNITDRFTVLHNNNDGVISTGVFYIMDATLPATCSTCEYRDTTGNTGPTYCENHMTEILLPETQTCLEHSANREG